MDYDYEQNQDRTYLKEQIKDGQSPVATKPTVVEEDAVVVPLEALQPETLRHLAVEFLLRETGNDISEVGVSEDRIERVLKALHRKTHFITFDQRTETVGIVDGRDLKKV